MPIPILVSAALALATEFAPALIRHFAGDKAGAVADTVASTAKILTGQDITTPEGLQAAQESLRQDKELSAQFQIKMAEIDLDTEKAYLADRQDARKRDVQITQQGYHNYRADIMLAFVFIALIYITYVINANAAMKPEVLAIFNMMIGALLKMIGDAFQFEFGSSRGSKTKDDEKSTLMKFMANGK